MVGEALTSTAVLWPFVATPAPPAAVRIPVLTEARRDTMANMPHPRAPGSRPTGAKSQSPAPSHEASGERASAIHLSRGAVQRADLDDCFEARRQVLGR